MKLNTPATKRCAPRISVQSDSNNRRSLALARLLTNKLNQTCADYKYSGYPKVIRNPTICMGGMSFLRNSNASGLASYRRLDHQITIVSRISHFRFSRATQTTRCAMTSPLDRIVTSLKMAAKYEVLYSVNSNHEG